MKEKVDQGIADVVGALTDPIIVFPGGWGDTLPDWLKDTITLERLVGNMKAFAGEKPTATDAETCAYLYTVSLTRPMGEQWTRIYLYVATQVCKKWKKADLPADITVGSISDEDTRELADLKDFIYRSRIEHRKGALQAERREEKTATGQEVLSSKSEIKAAKDVRLKFF